MKTTLLPAEAEMRMTEPTEVLCPKCHKANVRRARYCQHCGHDVVLNNDGPRYFITRVIKEGGQGAVFEAIDDAGKTYAVKQMLDRFADPRERLEAVDRFAAESRILETLSHPRIPRVYTAYQDEGFHYLVMDFVRGEDLEDRIRRSRSIDEAQVLVWADQICDVLGYLHGRTPPIIFRDMKPSNVMIEPDGGVKLIDFGIAKAFDPKRQSGTQIGTPGYAPPEQYQGLATPASDIFALGATLHHALTGRDPRDEQPFSFPAVYGLKPSVSRRVSEAITRALQMDPEKRFANVDEFRAALIPPKPAQVRVQPQRPVAAAASVAAPVIPMQQAAPVLAAPSLPPQSPPQPAAKPKRPARAPIRIPWGNLIGSLLGIVLLAATLLLAFPDAVSSILPAGVQLPQVFATTVPTAGATALVSFAVDIEVVLATGSTEQQIRDALFAEYEVRAKSQYGAGTVINRNQGLSTIGGIEDLGLDAGGGGTRFRARVSGSVRPGA